MSWYDRNRRSLPWRRDQPDPYHIWVAEIMLQQTQVVSVLPYWKRFIKRFPSLRRLASAAVQDVLELWSGLGSYRRAHFLHAAARRVVAEHAGRIPRDVETLMSLPGIGRYTAGAISSIAFGRRAPLVDGNVQRVLQRLFHPHASQASPRGAVSGVWRLAERLVPPGRPGDFNQALMELGALICLPASPRCDACPLARRCGARIAEVQDRIPPTKRRAPKRLLEVAALLVTRRRRVLLVRRPSSGLWAGLWDAPQLVLATGVDPLSAANELLGDLDFTADRLRLLDVVTRQLTHRVFRAHVFIAAGLRGAGPRSKRYKWHDPHAPTGGISRAAQQIIRLAAISH
ncbi:MAG: A/G-specific adenine glycosylase [Planctomycetes bacterium]|nr:A/G-specific adenine glycosylase [Planctomycetota bacterium]